MKDRYRILVINPGSTSTRVALFENDIQIFNEKISHPDAEIRKYTSVLDQLDMRVAAIDQMLSGHAEELKDLDGVVGRGGLLPGLTPGGYYVNETMCEVILSGTASPHASNLGALIADRIAKERGIPAAIYDAVSADSMTEVSRITGLPGVRRTSFCHVLNSRAMARKYAESLGKRYDDMRLLVAHLGGGISISAHKYGRIVDIISDDSGPFSPERAGSVPLLTVIDLCYSGKYTKEEMKREVRGQGGLRALLGTSDCQEIEARIRSGDEYATLCYDAQAYQIAKGIGNLAPALEFRIDAVILTGGLAYSAMLTDRIRYYLGPIAHIEVMPGENEMLAMDLGMLRILRGEEKAKEYVYTESAEA